MSAVRFAAVMAVASAASVAAPGHAAPGPPARVVVAIVGESGMNVLHDDFRTARGQSVTYPAALGPVMTVALPSSGTFADRRAAVAAGPLGHLAPGRLYGIRGTRLLVVSAPSAFPLTDVTGGGTTTITVGSSDDPTLHGTGVVDAAIGRRYGTAPDALALLVLGNSSDSWAWVAERPGIDVASTSGYEASTRCTAAADVRSFVGSGHPVFSSSGNTGDQGEALTSPNGLPEVYQVGGVTADGKPWGTPHADSNPFYAVGQVTRPYQTGELYDFPTAAYDSTTGTMRFGGTSGATPRTAGWAARLVGYARAHRSRHGPLADGTLSRTELVSLLRHVAVPSMPGQAGGFYVEGYGALNAKAIRHAEQILAGTATDPGRPDDDAREAQVEQVRAAAFADC